MQNNALSAAKEISVWLLNPNLALLNLPAKSELN